MSISHDGCRPTFEAPYSQGVQLAIFVIIGIPVIAFAVFILVQKIRGKEKNKKPFTAPRVSIPVSGQHSRGSGVGGVQMHMSPVTAGRRPSDVVVQEVSFDDGTP